MGLTAAAYYFGRRRAFARSGRAAGAVKLHSRPTYHGALTALRCAIPALILFGCWLAFETQIITHLVVRDLPESIRGLPADRLNLVINDIRNIESGSFVSKAADPAMLAYEAIRFLKVIPITQFLFGLDWSPQMAIRADPVGSSGAFGAVPVFLGTILISAIALLVAVPIGLMSAIYLSEYAGKRLRAVAKPPIELLAGIPTVVYGFFAALTVAPVIRNWGSRLGLDVASESALAAAATSTNCATWC